MSAEPPPELNSAEVGASRGPRGRNGPVPLRERYGLVLLLILAAYVVGGLSDDRWVLAANSVVWGALLLAALWSPGLPRGLRRVGSVATVLVLAGAITLGMLSSPTADGWRSLILAVAQLAALLAILDRVLRHDRVTLQTVMGGVAAYALLAFVAAALFHGIDLLTEAPFLTGVNSIGDYSYFSFVTLTTLGFGDITPATELAKRLVVVEAFVGQVFIITFVARLVSLWGQPFNKR